MSGLGCLSVLLFSERAFNLRERNARKGERFESAALREINKQKKREE